MKFRPKTRQNNETSVTAFIDAGGSVAGTAEMEKEKTFTLRIDSEISRLVDLSVAAYKKERRTTFSKNTWIMDAILQKLKAEGRLA